MERKERRARRERTKRPKKEFSILYVDDESPNLRGFKTTFRRFFNVYTALDLIEAMEIVRSTPLNIVVSDHRMPEMNGTDLLKEIYEYNPEIRRMILSGFIKRDELKGAVESFGIHGFVSKPWDCDSLRALFDKLLNTDSPELITFC